MCHVCPVDTCPVDTCPVNAVRLYYHNCLVKPPPPLLFETLAPRPQIYSDHIFENAHKKMPPTWKHKKRNSKSYDLKPPIAYIHSKKIKWFKKTWLYHLLQNHVLLSLEYRMLLVSIDPVDEI